MAAIAGQAIDPGTHQEMRAQLLRQPKQLVIIAFAVPDMNAAQWRMQQGSRALERRVHDCGQDLGSATVLDAIREGKSIPDAKLSTLFAFTTDMIESRGRPSVDSAKAFLAQGYTEKHILHIVLAITVKTLRNYSNHLFETRVADRFAAYKVG